MSIISCFPGGGSGSALKAQRIDVASGGSQTTYTFTSLSELNMVYMKVNYSNTTWVLIMLVDDEWINSSMTTYVSPIGVMSMTVSGNTVTAPNIATNGGGYIVGYGA